VEVFVVGNNVVLKCDQKRKIHDHLNEVSEVDRLCPNSKREEMWLHSFSVIVFIIETISVLIIFCVAEMTISQNMIVGGIAHE
jgi:hypothetical protein